VQMLERRASRENPRRELLTGAGIAASGLALAIAPALALERVLESRPRGWLGVAISAALLKTTFAWRELIRTGERVRRELEGEEQDAARHDLRALVSRDTTQLDTPLLAAAAIESLAENASDSFVAPLFYYQLFGLPGAFVYRAVNTMDAMIGYHGQYEFLGKLPARLDDALNLIPSRLTALLLVIASRLAGSSPHRACAVLRRDHARTASPNAGYPMSAVAGALDVRLEKVGYYRLNENGRAPEPADIHRAAHLVSFALGLAVVVSVLVQFARRR
jgi:adenosylcobinamide-phosphate synthase